MFFNGENYFKALSEAIRILNCYVTSCKPRTTCNTYLATWNWSSVVQLPSLLGHSS